MARPRSPSPSCNGHTQAHPLVDSNDLGESVFPKSEAAVLGAVILTADEGDTDKAAERFDLLDPGDFTDYRCAEVFRALRDLRRSGRPLDSITLDSQLRERGESGKAVAAWAVLLPNAEVTPSSSAFTSLLPELKAETRSRTFRDDFQTLSEAVASGRLAPEQVAQLLEQAARTARSDAAASIVGRLDSRRFRSTAKPPAPEPRFLLAETPIATPGNLCSISAGIKSGKSAILGAMIAAVVSPDPEGRDFLGVSSRNPDGHAVLHFDTEQSPFDHWQLIWRALRRAGVDEEPNWLRSYCLTGFSVSDARRALDAAVEEAMRDFGGIHSILVDGIADLVSDVNDPEEANGYVSHLHGRAIELGCPILCVIHLNPGTEKTRGHLGSQLERKAESNLRLEKEGETSKEGESIVVWSEKNRGAPIPKSRAPRFAWDENLGMHGTIQSVASASDDAKAARLRELAEAVLQAKGRTSLPWAEFIDAIAETDQLSTPGARKRFDAMRHHGVVSKGVLGHYVLAP